VCRAGLPLRRLQRGLRQRHLGFDFAQLLRSDGVLRQQRFAPRQFALGPLQVELAADDVRVALFGRRGLLADLPHRQGERAGRVRQRDLAVGRVEPHQHLAAVDALRLLGQHIDDRAAVCAATPTWSPTTYASLVVWRCDSTSSQ